MKEESIKKVDMEKIAREGDKIYQSIKSQYEPKENGKYLAIEVDNKKAYFGTTSLDAVNLAKKNHPDKIFFIVRIGFDAVETLASWWPKR